MRALSVAALWWIATASLMGCDGCGPAPRTSTPIPPASSRQEEPAARAPLKPVSAFAGIADPKARSIAIFSEAGRVIAHPRCVNCHPHDGTPRQGLDQHLHMPPVSGGESGHGVAGLPCAACHQATNTPIVGATLRSVPGNPKWALAPVEMAWLGKTLAQICQQIKDPARNGGKSLAQIHEHMAGDALVGWGWDPGPGLEPVPGTQQAFGALIAAWIEAGAHCPDS
jgi:hypothetical protein